MGTFKDLASIFVKLEDDSEGPPVSTVAAQPSIEKGGASVATERPSSQPAPDPLAESKLTDRLSQALEEGNLPGIDFNEFRKTLEALVTVIADEPTRYRAAFGSLVAQGAKGDHILDTADHYLKVLDQREVSFVQYMDQQQKERVQNKLRDAEALHQQIQAKSQEIARLTAEIGTLNQQELEARNLALLAKGELEAYGATFQAIKARFAGEIRDVQDKLRRYVMTPQA